jgi:hypothetical protein
VADTVGSEPAVSLAMVDEQAMSSFFAQKFVSRLVQRGSNDKPLHTLVESHLFRDEPGGLLWTRKDQLVVPGLAT